MGVGRRAYQQPSLHYVSCIDGRFAWCFDLGMMILGNVGLKVICDPPQDRPSSSFLTTAFPPKLTNPTSSFKCISSPALGHPPGRKAFGIVTWVAQPCFPGFSTQATPPTTTIRNLWYPTSGKASFGPHVSACAIGAPWRAVLAHRSSTHHVVIPPDLE